MEDFIDNRKKTIKEMKSATSMDEDHFEMFQKDLDGAEKDLKKIKAVMADEKVEKNNLLAGECRDIQNTCE